MAKKLGSILVLGVMVGCLVTGCGKRRAAQVPPPVLPKAAAKPQPDILSYQNSKTQPSQPLVLTLERKQWQALAAVCAVPAFYSRGSATPLLFDDGTEKRDVAFAHDAVSMGSLGTDAATASAAIAKKYWTKAESAFIVDNYEHALWVVPSAALMSAPVLVSPDASTLEALGVKYAVVLGTARAGVEKSQPLATKEDVWKFQLELAEAQGAKADYIVMTNPHDCDDQLNPNVQWPYLSLAAAPLGAYRGALMQTGDYTGDREKLHALGGALGTKEDKAKYEFVKPTFMKVKDDSYAIEKFMADNGSQPQFIALVGGAIELPYYFCDIHATWKYWHSVVHFVPAETPYATMRTDTDFTRFVKPDLAPGRIIGDSVLDATLLVARSCCYKDFLPGGRFASLAPAGWEKKAVLLDGHRLNQPDEGGPPASSDKPFYPSEEIMAAIKQAGYTVEYWLPKDVTNPSSEGKPIEQLLSAITPYRAVQFVAHGDPPFMRIELGGHGKKAQNYKLTGPKVRKLMTFKAPTVVYVIGCHTGTVYAPFSSNEEYLPPSFIHAGAVVYIAPHTCQSVCFWRYAPKGPASIQTVYFWDNALNKGMPLGQALIEAKWKAYEEWKDKQAEADRGKDSDNAAEPDGPTVLYFGDPALRISGQ
jgi:hypothetical protein